MEEGRWHSWATQQSRSSGKETEKTWGSAFTGVQGGMPSGFSVHSISEFKT